MKLHASHLKKSIEKRHDDRREGARGTGERKPVTPKIFPKAETAPYKPAQKNHERNHCSSQDHYYPFRGKQLLPRHADPVRLTAAAHCKKGKKEAVRRDFYRDSGISGLERIKNIQNSTGLKLTENQVYRKKLHQKNHTEHCCMNKRPSEGSGYSKAHQEKGRSAE